MNRLKIDTAEQFIELWIKKTRKKGWVNFKNCVFKSIDFSTITKKAIEKLIKLSLQDLDELLLHEDKSRIMGINFSGSTFENCNFLKSDLNSSIFDKTTIINCNFNEASLNYTTWNKSKICENSTFLSIDCYNTYHEESLHLLMKSLAKNDSIGLKNRNFSVRLNFFSLWQNISHWDKKNSVRVYVNYKNSNYVWDHESASKFIESCLLGLPQPGMTFYNKENELWVIDGNKRLKTIVDFLFNKFTLKNVQEKWEGKNFYDLSNNDCKKIMAETLLDVTILLESQIEEISEEGQGTIHG